MKNVCRPFKWRQVVGCEKRVDRISDRSHDFQNFFFTVWRFKSQFQFANDANVFNRAIRLLFGSGLPAIQWVCINRFYLFTSLLYTHFLNPETEHDAKMYVESKRLPPIATCLVEKPQPISVPNSVVAASSKSDAFTFQSVPTNMQLVPLDKNGPITRVSVQKQIFNTTLHR